MYSCRDHRHDQLLAIAGSLIFCWLSNDGVNRPYAFDTTTTRAAIGSTISLPLAYRWMPFSIATRIASNLSGDWRARSPAVRTPASCSASKKKDALGRRHSTVRVSYFIELPLKPACSKTF